MDDSALQPWLALWLLPEMQVRYYHKLLEVFGSPAAALGADPAAFAGAGFGEALVEALRDHRQRGQASVLGRAVARELEWRRQADRHILCLEDPAYPELLKAIPDPPPLIYVRGKPALLRSPQLAIVGSRKPSAGGRRLARRFAAQLAARGYAVTSGMARGIDGESHAGALDAGAATVAVLGCGADVIYPRQHRALAERIAAQGAIVSEFPLGTEALNWHFPQRNRIISGLSRGVLVVEAARRSGSLITARCALEQGREVFAVPGAIDNPQARGCHHLIRSGAKLVETLDDILEELGPFGSPEKAGAAESGDDLAGLGAEQKRVLAQVGYDSVSFDFLVDATGLDAGPLSAILIELEMQERIETRPGGYTLKSGHAF